MTIMIVDDNTAVRSTIRRILSGSGVSIRECSDGSEALAAYAQCHPDWVLMDIRMNEMDGFEATEKILASFPDAKIVIITQYKDSRLKDKAMLAGAKDFVSKENLIDLQRLLHMA